MPLGALLRRRRIERLGGIGLQVRLRREQYLDPLWKRVTGGGRLTEALSYVKRYWQMSHEV